MKSLPLGVDIGSSRLRIVQAIERGDGAAVRAVVARDIGEGQASSGALFDIDYIAAMIEEAHAELGTREKRCVISVGEPDAVLRLVEFPRMTGIERERAATFEAQRFVDYPLAEASVRIHPVDASKHHYAVGVVRTAAIRTRIEAIKKSGLRPIAVDHEALALFRGLPYYDAIIDIGCDRTNLHVMQKAFPWTLQHVAGGSHITRGIERELSIDVHSAEKRKRIVGTAGAGERARSSYLADLTALIESATIRTERLKRVALVGNGARLNNFASDIERATGLLVDIPAARILRGPSYPPDVLKAGAPDWNLAAGLCTWGMSAP